MKLLILMKPCKRLQKTTKPYLIVLFMHIKPEKYIRKWNSVSVSCQHF